MDFTNAVSGGVQSDVLPKNHTHTLIGSGPNEKREPQKLPVSTAAGLSLRTLFFKNEVKNPSLPSVSTDRTKLATS